MVFAEARWFILIKEETLLIHIRHDLETLNQTTITTPEPPVGDPELPPMEPPEAAPLPAPAIFP
ncbi:hypothetical protein [Nostoc sp. JL33]|uniref:hypothetical protein n=1 Tax=Nostoc sp. JL33 TaxID=2815396 RepID=UPI0025D0E4D5|nr:hypothetical protein [Nostoc sp. JL33]MBN3869980.1 hypothetical protein [Nostoc sp. JL33]